MRPTTPVRVYPVTTYRPPPIKVYQKPQVIYTKPQTPYPASRPQPQPASRPVQVVYKPYQGSKANTESLLKDLTKTVQELSKVSSEHDGNWSQITLYKDYLHQADRQVTHYQMVLNQTRQQLEAVIRAQTPYSQNWSPEAVRLTAQEETQEEELRRAVQKQQEMSEAVRYWQKEYFRSHLRVDELTQKMKRLQAEINQT